jgi:DNA (cytosine-5)-methyltransferase 1
MNELALFAGAGGGILGGKLLGWRTVCAVEWEPYPASVLCARQNDGLLPPFPIWDDVQTFNGFAWRGLVDVVSGGFPCQDISAAGKGAGIDGERSGMWKHMARVVSEVRPRFVFVENSPMLVTRGLERVLGDLTALGYDTKWTVMGAADVGANHQRDRIWIVAKAQSANTNLQSAYAKQECKHDWPQEFSGSGSREMGAFDAKTDLAYARCQLRETWDSTRLDSETQIGSASTIHNQPSSSGQSNVSNANLPQQQRGSLSSGIRQKHAYACDSRWWKTEPDVGRMADGVASGVDRLKAIGNGQVPLCAATAWKVLTA